MHWANSVNIFSANERFYCWIPFTSHVNSFVQCEKMKPRIWMKRPASGEYICHSAACVTPFRILPATMLRVYTSSWSEPPIKSHCWYNQGIDVSSLGHSPFFDSHLRIDQIVSAFSHLRFFSPSTFPFYSYTRASPDTEHNQLWTI